MVSFLSSLRCEARSQPWPTGVCGSMAPWNTTSLRSPVNIRRTTKRSASLVVDDTNSLTADGPVISVSCSSGSLTKVTPSPMPSHAPPRFSRRALLREGPGRRVEVELRPFRALGRPLGLGALDEPVDVTHLQEDAGLLVPAVLLAVQEIVEEFQLQRAPVVGVEMGPVLDAVDLEPFVLGGGAHEAFEIAARVQRLAAPIGGGQERRLDLRPDRRARPM